MPRHADDGTRGETPHALGHRDGRRVLQRRATVENNQVDVSARQQSLGAVDEGRLLALCRVTELGLEIEHVDLVAEAPHEAKSTQQLVLTRGPAAQWPPNSDPGWISSTRTGVIGASPRSDGAARRHYLASAHEYVRCTVRGNVRGGERGRKGDGRPSGRPSPLRVQGVRRSGYVRKRCACGVPLVDSTTPVDERCACGAPLIDPAAPLNRGSRAGVASRGSS